MRIVDFFLLWEDIGLFLYASLKAFLPIPSLEFLLIPLCLHMPSKWFLYTLEGTLGTMIGSIIGYGLSNRIGYTFLSNYKQGILLSKSNKSHLYSLFLVFIGAITPIPDFLLPYYAGFIRLPLIPFLIVDGFARYMRSFMVCYSLYHVHQSPSSDHVETIITMMILIVGIYYWYKKRYK